MFQPGELVVYGTTGVCRVLEIAKPQIRLRERDREYYLLKPLYQDGVIYSPVDSEKVAIRPVMTRAEAEKKALALLFMAALCLLSENSRTFLPSLGKFSGSPVFPGTGG